MAEVNGKAKSEVEEAPSSEVEFEPTLKAFERDVRAMGPWTEEDERFVQILLEEFGGSGVE
jgi:hypothetical protein